MTLWQADFVQAGDLRIHYHRTGDGSKPALLLLHGILDDGACWGRVAREFEADFDIIMPDARGHGQTQGTIPEAYTYDVLAEDARQLILALGLEQPLLFGHSLGAMTSATLAAKHPELVRGAILEDPPLLDPTQAAAMSSEETNIWQQLIDFGKLPREERIRKAALFNPQWVEAENIPWGDSKASFNPVVLRHVQLLSPWRTILEKLQAPVLLLTGDPEVHAIVTPTIAQEVRDLWQERGRVVHIPGAGHCIHRDRWEESIAHVRAFLASI